MSIIKLCSLLRAKSISSEELTREYLDRIAENDNQIGAYINVTAETALRQAREVDRHRVRGEELPVLAGIPFALKDNICTEGITTTCASRMLSDYVPPYNATVAERLYSFGGVLLGKLNMDEFAMGSATDTSAIKKTRNPLDLSRVPGGSSGGSAAAVASDQAVFTLGSDTGGSVRQPAAFCGAVGMKATYGTVSRYGLVAFAPSLEQIGPITSTVRDNAIVLDAIAGRDALDGTTRDVTDSFTDDISNGISGLRIGIAEQYLDLCSSDVREAILSAAKALEDMGSDVEPVDMPSADAALAAYYVLSSSEASSNLSRFDGVRYGYRAQGAQNVTELFVRSRTEGFGDEVKRRIMLGTLALSRDGREQYYLRAMAAKRAIQTHFDGVFERYDALIMPVAPTVAYKMSDRSKVPIEIYKQDMFCVHANLTGLPSLTLPCGAGEGGMPTGLQIMGKAFSEPMLYRIGHSLECALKGDGYER